MIEGKTSQVVLLETRPNLLRQTSKVLKTEYFVGKSLVEFAVRRIKLRDLRAWFPGMQFLRALTLSRKVEVSRDSYRYNNSNQRFLIVEHSKF